MRHRITITLTEEEFAALEQVGERLHCRQDWMGPWRAKLLHRAVTAFLNLAGRERISFPLRLEFSRADGDIWFEGETIPAPPVKPPSNLVNIWHLFRPNRS